MSRLGLAALIGIAVGLPLLQQCNDGGWLLPAAFRWHCISLAFLLDFLPNSVGLPTKQFNSNPFMHQLRITL
ncbi:uncharacterized protein BDZ83DRAFT_258752 [Colletotrichum acutatum]|uniref:Uncharacterized protein n=1 Tax=Glomerella acutata TaxID=27357 RepID=A0AAD8UQI1_GLOAC|nr:uncharacterized protein BDZ83DRAFT_258752 [Colletotrichum acutatum]KAK1726455.1 hypothetical protein BDZ83DRAFT_258752 [Colletotrichum acutatum]